MFICFFALTALFLLSFIVQFPLFLLSFTLLDCSTVSFDLVKKKNHKCIYFNLTVQAKMNKGYPYLYSSTALMAFMGSVQSVAFSICMDRDWKQWKLGWNIQLLAMSYSVTDKNLFPNLLETNFLVLV